MSWEDGLVVGIGVVTILFGVCVCFLKAEKDERKINARKKQKK